MIIAIDDRREPHWIAIYGWRLANAKTRGRWVAFDDHGLHASSPVETAWIGERR